MALLPEQKRLSISSLDETLNDSMGVQMSVLTAGMRHGKSKDGEYDEHLASHTFSEDNPFSRKISNDFQPACSTGLVYSVDTMT